MRPNQTELALLDRRFDDICNTLVEAIRREVERRLRAGLPVYAAENGKIIDLQAQPSDHSGH